MDLKKTIKKYFFKFLEISGYEQHLLQKQLSEGFNTPYSVLPKIIDSENEIIFIDVGGNTGQTIDYISGLYKKSKIYSFEPTPALKNNLENKYKNNENVSINFCALGDYNGFAKFYCSEFSPTNSLLKPKSELYRKLGYKKLESYFNKINEEIVPIVKLSDWYKDHLNGRIVDVLKIDTQGSEYEVLIGTKEILDKIKIIIFEGHFHEFYNNSTMWTKNVDFLYQEGFYVLDFFNKNKLNNLLLLECDFVLLNRKFFEVESLKINAYKTNGKKSIKTK
jgi:FkbM family methyltransferase